MSGPAGSPGPRHGRRTTIQAAARRRRGASARAWWSRRTVTPRGCRCPWACAGGRTGRWPWRSGRTTPPPGTPTTTWRCGLTCGTAGAPQTFMEIGLHGAGYDVTGVTIPGTVAVQVGVGAHDAWSVTSGGTDNSDWYADTIDPAGHPGQYLFDGRWQPYACRTGTIDVYHRPARHYRVCQGRHGPVNATSGHTTLALRDAGADGIDGTITGFLAVDAARSLAQFAAALPRFAGSFNFLYADQAGNIAYWQVGHVPVRAPGDNPFLVHPGTGGDEWRGFLPWPAMPHVINPAH